MPKAKNYGKRRLGADATAGANRLEIVGVALAVMVAGAFLLQALAVRAQQGAEWQKAQKVMSGFATEQVEKEQAAEEKLRAAISTEQIQKYHRYFTAEPHPAGSPRNNELAQYVAEEWRKQGLEDVAIHEYDVLHSSPREVSLEMVSPVPYRASLREEPYDVDPDTKNPNVSMAYLGYSASGEVTAPVVYAHSGNPEDYELLKKRGISVRGKIVLVRYSNPYSYRGFKALTAQREGAAALLIYSDPAEDGYSQGKVFPRRAVGAGEPYSARRDHLRFSGSGRSADSGMGVRAGRKDGFRSGKRCRCRKLLPCRFRGTMRNHCSNIWMVRWRRKNGKEDCR